MTLRSRVIGCGAYLPEKVVTNADLAARLETTDEWIRQRTGIAQRHIAAEGELTSDLATRAAELIAPRVAIPIHYGTWPPIAQDPAQFAPKGVEVRVLTPGQSWTCGG